MPTPLFEDLPYRPCVGVALFDAGGRVFIGQRKGGVEHVGSPFLWQMPQGGIDEGEDPATAALRELYEETNIRSATIIAEVEGWLPYELPQELALNAWNGRWKGQTQKWYALRFTGDEAEIDVDRPGGGHHKPEFAAWRWARLAETPDLVIPFKRAVYARVAEAFAHLAG